MSDSTRQAVLFREGFDRPVTAAFDADAVTSDGGAVLLRAIDRRLGLCERLAGCVLDGRAVERVRHEVLDLLRQRVYSIALGYPEANAADRLLHDPALALAIRGECGSGRALASQPTLSRWENAPTPRELLAMGSVLLRSAVEAVARQDPHPARVVIDLDPSVDPAHGEQQGVLFNGFYGTHCYLPVFGFLSVEGRPGHHLFLARLRPGNATAWRATRRSLKEAIRQVRDRFPKARLLVRLDAGYGRGPLLDLLEAQNVEYLVGFQPNVRIQRVAGAALGRVERRTRRSAKESREVFARRYRAKSWNRSRRVIVRAQAALQPGRQVKATARFVITNTALSPSRAYETYCGRGDAENRIKELKLDLEIDRTSCSRFCANQLRVLITAAAYVLLDALRARAGGTELATSQVARLRMALLRVGARVTTSVRRVVLHLASAHPWAAPWRRIALRVGALAG